MLLRSGQVLVQDRERTRFCPLDLRVLGDVIVAMEEHLEPKGGEEVISVEGKWVLPGLIDAHVHTAGLFGDVDPYRNKDMGVAEVALRAAHSARKHLWSGFTSLRDLGGRDYVDVALRKAINEGLVIGPRMFVSGRALCMTGGHASQLLRSREIDGRDEARRGARAQIAESVDQIKVMATGGGISPTGGLGVSQLSLEELTVIVEEARKAGKRVAAHAHGLEGIRNAMKAGVDSIEHGTFADEEALVEMARRGLYLVVCIGATAFMASNQAVAAGLPGFMHEKCKVLLLAQERTFRKACELEVPIAFGSDCGTPLNPPGRTTREFEFLVKNGMTKAQAINAATIEAAKLIGVEDQIGSLEANKKADILVLNHNPLQDIGVLMNPEEEIYYLFKDGLMVNLPPATSYRDRKIR